MSKRCQKKKKLEYLIASSFSFYLFIINKIILFIPLKKKKLKKKRSRIKLIFSENLNDEKRFKIFINLNIPLLYLCNTFYNYNVNQGEREKEIIEEKISFIKSPNDSMTDWTNENNNNNKEKEIKKKKNDRMIEWITKKRKKITVWVSNKTWFEVRLKKWIFWTINFLILTPQIFW